MNIVFIFDDLRLEVIRFLSFLSKDKNNNIILITSHIYNENDFKNLNTYFLTNKEKEKQIFSHLKQINQNFTPEIIISSGQEIVSVFLSQIFVDVPYIVWPRTIIDDDYILSLMDNNVDYYSNLITNLILNKEFNSCNHILVGSIWQKKNIIDSCHHKIKYIPDGVNIDFFDANASILYENKNIVCLVDDFTKNKIIKSLESIVSNIKIKNDKIIFISYGQSLFNKKEKILEFFKHSSFRNRYILEYNPDIYKLRDILNNSLFFIYAIENNAGYNNLLLEAMACKCLVVAPDTDYAREYIEDGNNGFLFNLYDKNSLWTKIDSILNYPSFMYPLKEKARQVIVKKYSIANDFKQKIKFIKNNLKNKKRFG